MCWAISNKGTETLLNLLTPESTLWMRSQVFDELVRMAILNLSWMRIVSYLWTGVSVHTGSSFYFYQLGVSFFQAVSWGNRSLCERGVGIKDFFWCQKLVLTCSGAVEIFVPILWRSLISSDGKWSIPLPFHFICHSWLCLCLTGPSTVRCIVDFNRWIYECIGNIC